MRAEIKFQSTLLRRSDEEEVEVYYKWQISIHAPAKERPAGLGKCRQTANISIHAPAKERHFCNECPHTHTEISIHAPAKERHNDKQGNASKIIFQSTLLRRSDYNITPFLRAMGDFNPRSCEGATPMTIHDCSFISISIHAPAKERRFNGIFCAHFLIFQSTLLRRSDEQHIE